MNLILDTIVPMAAVLTPLLTVAAMNLLLALAGERGTLLLPTDTVGSRGS